MATTAIIHSAAFQPHTYRQAATLIAVALQAAIPKIGRGFARLWNSMGIVAGDAPEPAAAGAETEALSQLFELADNTVLGRASCPFQDRPEFMKRQSRTVVLIPTVGAKDAPITVQVALLANGIPQRRFQKNGVDDRHVPVSL
jgi:hypothetical protein